MSLSSNPNILWNVLFGVLAVQLNFLDASQLTAALKLWKKSKHLKLDEILVEEQLLARKQCDVIAAMVAEYLRVHEDDAQASLESTSISRRLYSELSTVDLEELQESLDRMKVIEDGESTAAYHHAEPSGRYRVLYKHASGGLGELFVAQDSELDRQVALKEIKGDHAFDPDSRKRFNLEAQITGGLEHPGIVPVYGYGLHSNGRPYYAMRLIRGCNLKDAIDKYYERKRAGTDSGELSLEFRGLLGRFIDVCNTMAYAHSRGVLHRDIKPHNIMLGKYGETLVVDWGLAKSGTKARAGSDSPDIGSSERTWRPSSDENEPDTRLGARIGTPAYMSPEQAAGRSEQLSPATDIYSLGATLYAILTGVPAFPGKADELIEKVKRGEFQAPRLVNKEVPIALEFICLKAMALHPDGRYSSASQLGQEIERWLADEPVQAYREPAQIRVRRWMRRHRTLVSSLGVAILIATTLLTVYNYRLTKTIEVKQRLLSEADKLTDSTLQFLNKNNSAVALASRAEATYAFLASAIAQAKTLRDLEPHRPERANLVAMLIRLTGNVFLLREHTSQAITHLTEAQQQYESPLLRVHDRLGSNQFACSTDLAIALTAAGQFAEAETVLDRNLERPSETVDKHELARAYIARSDLRVLQDKHKDGEHDARAAIRELEPLTNSRTSEQQQKQPTSAESRMLATLLLSFACKNVAVCLREQNDTKDKAIPVHSQSIAAVNAVAKANRLPEYDLEVCYCEAKLEQLKSIQRNAPSIASSSDVTALKLRCKELTVRYPSVPSTWRLLAQTILFELKHSQNQTMTADTRESLKRCEKELAASQAYVSRATREEVSLLLQRSP